MSEENEAVLSCCAACGIAEVDDIKLKECGECDLVRYCSNACQKNHKSQHKEACKMRAAELRDELLFRQPESNHHGDCPICCLPLSIDKEKSCMISCCSKVVCEGCDHANKIREIEGKLKFKCPFCRTPITSNDEADKQRTNRIKMNDPVAICPISRKETLTRHLSILQKLLDWETWRRIICCHFCITMGMALRRTGESKYTIWSRLPLVVILELGTILDATKRKVAILREQ